MKIDKCCQNKNRQDVCNKIMQLLYHFAPSVAFCKSFFERRRLEHIKNWCGFRENPDSLEKADSPHPNPRLKRPPV